MSARGATLGGRLLVTFSQDNSMWQAKCQIRFLFHRPSLSVDL